MGFLVGGLVCVLEYNSLICQNPLCVSHQLVVVNSFFQKRESHKITYRSGNNRTEIDLLYTVTHHLGSRFALQNTVMCVSVSNTMAHKIYM